MLPKNNCVKISCVNDITALIEFVENHQAAPEMSKTDFAVELLESSELHQNSRHVSFLIEQLKLAVIPKNARRYSNLTMVMSSTLYVHSPSAYNSLLNLDLLCLPHPRNLNKLVCRVGELGDSTISRSIRYLKGKLKYLKEHELWVNFLLDEIYIQPNLTFKGGCIYGNSENSTEMAKTAQVFMLTSILSDYKDVVGIIPVHKMTAVQLHYLINEAIREIESLGFKIVSLISDNNAVNRKAFELFVPSKTLQPYIPHPLDQDRLLFFIFDPVHIIKCLRNNWISSSRNGILKFPSIKTNNDIVMAEFKNLETVYNMENCSLVKYCHMLSFKVLYPSSIEKQNVRLALKLFNDANIAALKCLSKDFPQSFCNVDGTLEFMETVIIWWKIVNVKNVWEGARFNDKWRESIRQEKEAQVEFLVSMTNWLKTWRQSVDIKDALTAQTFQAIINTNEAFLKLIHYLFQNVKIDYILLGKFQNDDLESRFGQYRQNSGANYYIGLTQILESERKLRFKSFALLSSENEHVTLKTLMPSEEKVDMDICIASFVDILPTEFTFDNVPKILLPVLVYIAGYSVMKERKNTCSVCVRWLQIDKTVEIEESEFIAQQTYEGAFLTQQDRGKLTLPTNEALMSTCIPWLLLGKLLESHKQSFLLSKGQLTLLYKLSCVVLERQPLPLHETCSCDHSLLEKFKKVTLRACRIFLNNYTKCEIEEKGDRMMANRKIRKLNPQ